MKTTEEEGLVMLMVGLALGLLAGVLWAPRSGKQTRRALRRSAEDGLDYLGEEAEQIRERADRLAENTKRWLARLKNSGRSMKAGLERSLPDLSR